MPRDHTKLLIGWAAVLGLVMLSGCSGQQSQSGDKVNVASNPPAEASPSVQTPTDSTKGGSDKASPPVNLTRETRSIAELIEAAKQMKEGAVDALAAAGPKAIPAISAELRRDDRRYSWSTAAMAKMGPDAVQPVAALLNDSDCFMRKIAYLTLAEMGPTAMPALPALQRAAQQDRDPRNRGLAASAISQISGR